MKGCKEQSLSGDNSGRQEKSEKGNGKGISEDSALLPFTQTPGSSGCPECIISPGSPIMCLERWKPWCPTVGFGEERPKENISQKIRNKTQFGKVRRKQAFDG
jgi:hypothetical protein